MWFAALDATEVDPWFQNLMLRLLEGSPSVLALLDSNPFPDRPPQYLRAKLYDYRFADRRTHAETGQWWVRRLERSYFPQVSLADFERAGSMGVQ
jgi:lipase maturation factor 1